MKTLLELEKTKKDLEQQIQMLVQKCEESFDGKIRITNIDLIHQEFADDTHFLVQVNTEIMI